MYHNLLISPRKQKGFASRMEATGTNISAVLALVISVVGSVIGVINHKRVRSTCCGKNVEVSVDIENTTPPRIQSPPV